MTRSTVAIALLAALTPVAVAAHHGWSSYDETRPITLTGPLRDVSWGNPHGTARMTWQNRAWDVVLAPVSRMESRGLSRDSISDGQRITITGYARRDGVPEMRLERVQVNGTVIELR